MAAGQSCEKCGATNSCDAIYCSACGQRIPAKAAPAPPLSAASDDLKNTEPQYDKGRPFSYASTGRRIIGGLIDTVIVITLSMIPTILILMTSNPPRDFSPEQYAKILGGCFGLIVSVAYEALLQSSRHQATLGQRLMKVKVTDLHGIRIPFSKALVRTLASCISSVIFKLGYAIQPFTSRKQTLHDLAAGTIVLNADQDGGASFPPRESAGSTKPSIWKQKQARYYALGILGLAVLIGLLFVYSSQLGLFGPAKYDVYFCKEKPTSAEVGSISNLAMNQCEEVPKYAVEFRVDKASASVYKISEPCESIAAENSYSRRSSISKLSDCDILDEQNWVCDAKTTDVGGGVLVVGSRWQMVKGAITMEPGHFLNAYSGKRTDGPMTIYEIFKKK
jgi:uncharacterized RDD family membrane protein YckC